MDFLGKLENFLFDILGLILPGIILILVVISPLYFLDLISSQSQTSIDGIFGWLISLMAGKISSLDNLDSKTLIFLFLLLSYILGHVVKVFSIIFYDFGKLIFDKFINKLVIAINNLIFSQMSQKVSEYFRPFRNVLDKIFRFKPEKYEAANENMVEESMSILNAKLNTNYPKEWYSLYKLSVVINNQEKLKSLAGFFLAKYNLYRSLSFIFFLAIFYIIFLFRAIPVLEQDHISQLRGFLLFLNLVVWLTFHIKFKKYWKLCGNESLVSVYYYLNKEKLK